jgi:hypothetical protein
MHGTCGRTQIRLPNATNAQHLETLDIPLSKLLLCEALHNSSNAESLFMRSREAERTIESCLGDTLAEFYGLENCA